jgi:hypothetical protein
MTSKLRIAAVAALALLGSAAARAQDTCSVPGTVVATDPAGDQLGAPVTTHADILSVAIAEPPSAEGKLVITFKVGGLSTLTPDTLWILRFVTDVPPTNGDDEWWVAMLTGPDATPHFVYGSDGLQAGAPNEPRRFQPAGSLDAASNFNADGTITLVLDRSAISGLDVGQFLYTLIPMTHVITPTDGTLPFLYGFRSASDQVIALDDSTADLYEIEGTEACSAKSGFDILAGAFTPASLLFLILGGLLRRRAH